MLSEPASRRFTACRRDRRLERPRCGWAYEAGLAYFSRASRPEELISLSFALEEGNRVFYARHIRRSEGEEAASIFRSMAQAEERHKETLRELHARVSGKGGNPSDPVGMEAEDFWREGSAWRNARVAKGKTLEEILELAIAMEANAWTVTSRWEGGHGQTVHGGLPGALPGRTDTPGRMTSLLDRLQGKG